MDGRHIITTDKYQQLIERRLDADFYEVLLQQWLGAWKEIQPYLEQSANEEVFARTKRLVEITQDELKEIVHG